MAGPSLSFRVLADLVLWLGQVAGARRQRSGCNVMPDAFAAMSLPRALRACAGTVLMVSFE